jgi:hypothetical protein
MVKMRENRRMKKSNRTMLERILEPSTKKANIFYLCLIVMLVLFALLSPEKDLGLVQDEVFSLNDQWEVVTGSHSFEEVTLPYHIADDQTKGRFSISKTIDEDFEDEMYLRIRASMQDITVIAKGEVIYESKRNNESFLTFPEVSMWHFIKLPRSMKGEILKIDFSTKIDTFKGMFLVN